MWDDAPRARAAPVACRPGRLEGFYNAVGVARHLGWLSRPFLTRERGVLGRTHSTFFGPQPDLRPPSKALFPKTGR